MENNGEAARDASCRTTDVSTARGANVSGQAEIVEERGIERLGAGDAGSRKGEDIGAVEALAVRLGLDVARVHVIRGALVAATVVQVDVTEERPARALLRGLVVGAEPAGVDGASGIRGAVAGVIDETLGRVELAASLAAHGVDVRSLDGSAAAGVRDIGPAVGGVGLRKSGQAEDEAQLTNGRLAHGVGAHVDGVLSIGEHHVVGEVKIIVVGHTLDDDIVALDFPSAWYPAPGGDAGRIMAFTYHWWCRTR